MKQLLLIAFLLVSTTNMGLGQNVLFYPANPTWEDTITVICGVFSASSPCMLLSSELLVENMEFTAELCHLEGMLSSPCVSSDTFRIRVPDDSPGVYTFNCVLNLNNDNTLPFDSACTEYAWTHTIQIPVSNPLSVSNIDRSYFQLLPNPTSDVVNLDFSALQAPLGMTIRVVDVLGRDVTPSPYGYSPLQGGEPLRWNVSQWPEGIYLITITDHEGNRYTERLVVQH